MYDAIIEMIEFDYLFDKVSELLFELLKNVLDNKGMICLNFRNESDLMFNEALHMWQTKVWIDALIAYYMTNV